MTVNFQILEPVSSKTDQEPRKWDISTDRSFAVEEYSSACADGRGLNVFVIEITMEMHVITELRDITHEIREAAAVAILADCETVHDWHDYYRPSTGRLDWVEDTDEFENLETED